MDKAARIYLLTVMCLCLVYFSLEYSDTTIYTLVGNVSQPGLYIDNIFSYVNKTLTNMKQSHLNLTTCNMEEKRSSSLRNFSFPCTHFMQVSWHGRTGNNMFELAALLGSSMKHGYTALVPNKNRLKQIFRIPNMRFLRPQNVASFNESAHLKYDQRIDDLDHYKNWTLEGYFQSWRYFEEIEHVIRIVFQFKSHIASEVRDFINKVKTRSVRSVCLQVRRGDFKKRSAAAPVSYIKTALKHFWNKYKQIHIFVVSDEKGWCKNNLKFDNMTISPFKSAGYDLALMAFCDHVIVTSGTFGWWGGWLSNGDVVYWNGYPPKHTSLGRRANLTEYYPKSWIGLP